MKYPRKVYKNVLLIDGKIVGWKTGETHWKSVEEATWSRQPMWIFFDEYIEKISVESTSAIVHSDEENNRFFQDDQWYKQFEIHENFSPDMFLPY